MRAQPAPGDDATLNNFVKKTLCKDCINRLDMNRLCIDALEFTEQPKSG